jgi:hypothetical protein
MWWALQAASGGKCRFNNFYLLSDWLKPHVVFITTQ